MALGLGKMPADALVFPTLDDGPQTPSDVSRAWGLVADELGMPEITFHGLRHTHASQLIDAGVDIVTISKRLGHASPDVTLRVYAHLFHRDDDKAAAAINAALAGAAWFMIATRAARVAIGWQQRTWAPPKLLKMPDGGMPERSNGAVSKTVVRASVPWVRIPLPPPEQRLSGALISR